MQRVVTITFSRDDSGTIHIMDSAGGNVQHRYSTAKSRLDYLQGYTQALEEAGLDIVHVHTALVDGEKQVTQLWIGGE